MLVKTLRNNTQKGPRRRSGWSRITAFPPPKKAEAGWGRSNEIIEAEVCLTVDERVR